MTDKSQLLHAFANDDDLQRLDTLLGEFNIFEAIGMANQEIYHSRFLAFLLNPRESHGLGDGLLKAVLRLSGHDSAKLESMDLSATQVTPEWQNIDIIAVNHSNKLVVVIENKIYSGENGDQLQRYHDTAQRHYSGHRIECIYLTPHGTIPSHPSFRALSYVDLAREIERLAAVNTLAKNETVRTTMKHYVQLLRRRIMGDEDIERLCLEIYRQHKKAIDQIVKHLPTQQVRLQEKARYLVEHTDGLKFTNVIRGEGGLHVSFLPVSWEELIPREVYNKQWAPSGHRLQFWFSIRPHEVIVSLNLNSGTEDELQRLADIAQRHFPLLKKIENNKFFLRLYLRTILDGDQMANAPLDILLEMVDDWWTQFSTDDLPKIEAIYRDELQPSYSEPEVA